MNNTEKELFELGRKVARNYKIIVTVAAFLYGCFIFVSTQTQHSQTLIAIQNQHAHDIAQLKQSHSELEKRVSGNEKNFQMTSVKLDTTLNRISTDLQFIKQKFIERGMK